MQVNSMFLFLMYQKAVAQFVPCFAPDVYPGEMLIDYMP
jgi:hypothetical protein